MSTKVRDTPGRTERGAVRILVTGVRGKTGLPLAELLAARPEVEVLGGSGDPAAVDLPGVRPVAFSWDDPSGWAAATDGADAVYVVRPDRADAPELIEAVVATTTVRARVVLLSERNADDTGPDGWAPRAERAVTGGGRDWTILRPGWFMQVFTDPRFYRDRVAAGGELLFPSGGASVAWIDARDIAAVAERTLLGGHDGRVYELTGPEALTLPRTAELVSRATGRRLVHREGTVEEAVNGTEGFQRDLDVLTFRRVQAGRYAVVTDTVREVTGQPARTLAGFLADHAADLTDPA